MTRKKAENGRNHLWNLELMCVSEGYSLEGKDGWGWGRKQFTYCRNSAKEETTMVVMVTKIFIIF